jgi:hypothetical protein
MSKKKPKMKQFRVPMTWEWRGYADVWAIDAEDAEDKCKAGAFNDGVELDECTAEFINWEVTGDAKEDDDEC